MSRMLDNISQQNDEMASLLMDLRARRRVKQADAAAARAPARCALDGQEVGSAVEDGKPDHQAWAWRV